MKNNKGKHFRSIESFDQCYLSGKEVVDKKSEALKLQFQNTVNNFLDVCKHMLFENGHYKREQEIDVLKIMIITV